ncbi:carbohydrate sulfotransferase 11-like, partial [Mytilus trossulus]|uniref:carbohydrate sulfotransferase 11-like n=1 Tax=Mytilus trossulus TaxID=6551 RepID=UPI00300776D8
MVWCNQQNARPDVPEAHPVEVPDYAKVTADVDDEDRSVSENLPRIIGEKEICPPKIIPVSDHTIGAIIKSRKHNLDKQCYNRIDIGRSDEDNFKAHMQFVPEERMVYCGIEKVGSIFWRRIIQLLHTHELQSPYSIKPRDCMQNYKSLQSQKLDNYDDILKENSKFLFVRDPYSRLLSGYLDKIFSPNPYYWNLIGSKAVEFTRKQKKTLWTRCYVSGNGGIFHTHRRTKYPHCPPCFVKYDYIGKMETFADDVHFILKEFNLENYTFVLKDFKTDSILDSITDTVETFRDVRSTFTKCLSIYGGLQRIWRKLQIRGIISEQIKFPFNTKNG